ncbi:hypothetical protein PCURB6_15430 [Paenibacillus curdlanolyticus]|nr:hypothetical protein PCURB6_15430 [Paenibacillus curdlanolyticus]
MPIYLELAGLPLVNPPFTLKTSRSFDKPKKTEVEIDVIIERYA